MEPFFVGDFCMLGLVVLDYTPENNGGFICAMVKSRYIGDGHPTFNRESL